MSIFQALKLCFLLILFIFLHVTYSPRADAETIRINGSSTVNYVVFNANNLPILKEKSGTDFETIITSSGRGVRALYDGRADVAIISSDFNAIVEKVNEAKNINPDDFDLHEIAKSKVLFIAHPDNPLKTITREQAKALLTGTVKSWEALGIDKDLGSLKIVTEHKTGGMFNIVLNTVTDKIPITEKRIEMQNAPQVAIVVSQIPGSFGFISQATPQDKKRQVSVLEPEDFEAIQEMYFVTRKGEDRPEIFNLIKVVQSQQQK